MRVSQLRGSRLALLPRLRQLRGHVALLQHGDLLEGVVLALEPSQLLALVAAGHEEQGGP